MTRLSLCFVLLLCVAGLAQAGNPCTDEKCTAPPAVVVTIPQPMPGPRPAPTPGVTVNVNGKRGPVARVIVAIFGRGSGTTVNVR